MNVVESDVVIDGYFESSTANIGDQFIGGQFFQQLLGVSQVRADKSRELRSAAQSAIIGGKQSNALGAMHTYPTTKDDQAFLTARYSKAVALGAAGEPYKFMCADAEGVWSRREHTAEQIIAVALAVEGHITDQLNKLDQLIADLSAAEDAEDLEAIEAIVW
ncbi:DUF4376 domain-containing protein [Methylomonas fluvii]|uniref:DUF4376 domain-containing protein n=1 Tax=Methylomonas fluvii TaxID=1854564 RepID=A0ABR9DIG5_9GAMM|nr:hypothetical protein [Methylomonas fluvii]MBD9362896.1 hypothetical protein [Methylomonas fluvii]